MHTWVAKYGGEDLLLRRILAPQVGAAVAIAPLVGIISFCVYVAYCLPTVNLRPNYAVIHNKQNACILFKRSDKRKRLVLTVG